MSESQPTQGVIEAVLPRALYRVQLEGGEKLTASLAPTARQATVKLLPGDSVMVAVSPYDPTRGRITKRLT